MAAAERALAEKASPFHIPADPERSTLVVLRPRSQSAPEVVGRLGRAGVDVAGREGNVRIAPHLVNTPEQIAAVGELLDVS